MRWIELNNIEQVDRIKNALNRSLIFKHSTRCPISMMAKRNLEANEDLIPTDVVCYYLDLLNYREVSNYVAMLFQVPHQSPQAILIKNGECVLELTHEEILPEEIAEVANQA